jgi:hypothetical protein
VEDLTIKEILRHSDFSETRAGYIKRVDEKSVEAMVGSNLKSESLCSLSLRRVRLVCQP